MDKGNIVKSNEHGTDGLLLAITNDGKRGKIKVFGRDDEVWRPLDSMTVIEAGDESCWKCGGSGIFQGGGMVLNGNFTGYTGDCFACQGKGKQNNDDRLRNHYYWHRAAVVDEAVAEAERGEFESLERTAAKVAAKPKPKIKSKKKNHPDPERKALGKPRGRRSHSGGAIPAVPVSNDDSAKLVDCKGCGTLHRDDTLCPW